MRIISVKNQDKGFIALYPNSEFTIRDLSTHLSEYILEKEIFPYGYVEVNGKEIEISNDQIPSLFYKYLNNEMDLEIGKVFSIYYGHITDYYRLPNNELGFQ